MKQQVSSTPLSHQNTALTILLIVLSMAGAILFLISTPNGVSTEQDSYVYVGAAQSLLAGEGYVHFFFDTPLVHWTPLYPTILAPVTLISDAAGSHVLDGVRWLNAVTIGLIIFVSGRFYALYIRSRALVVLAVGLIVCSDPILIGAFFLYSETLFLLLVMLGLLQLTHFVRTPSTHRWMFLTVIAALACLQRYTGTVLVATGGLAMLALMHDTPLRKRIQYAVTFGGMSLAPLLLWMLRNYRLTGTLTGSREGGYPLQTNLSRTYTELTNWFWPDWITVGYFYTGALVILAGLLALGVAYRRDGKLTLSGVMNILPMPPALLFSVLYLAMLVISATFNYFMPINTRLVQPVYPTLVGVFVVLVDRGASMASQHFNRSDLVYGGAVVLVGVTMVHPVTRYYDRVKILSRSDYNQIGDLAPLVYLREHELEGEVYTNAPGRLLLFASINPNGVPYDIADWPDIIRAASPDTSHWLVWFDDLSDCRAPRPERSKQICYTDLPYSLDELGDILRLDPVLETSEGGVYQLGLRIDQAQVGFGKN